VTGIPKRGCSLEIMLTNLTSKERKWLTQIPPHTHCPYSVKSKINNFWWIHFTNFVLSHNLPNIAGHHKRSHTLQEYDIWCTEIWHWSVNTKNVENWKKNKHCYNFLIQKACKSITSQWPSNCMFFLYLTKYIK
jgi:hypothetical protein